MSDSAKKLIQLLNYEQRKNSVYFLILLFFSTIFEGLSIALVFPLIKIILDPSYLDYLNGKISFLEIGNLSNEKIIVFTLILIASVYFFKTIYLIFFSWWKSNFIFKMNNDISNRLFNKYIYSPYSYFFNRNSSEFIRNIYEESRYINQSIDGFFKMIIEIFSTLIILIVLLTIQFKITFFMIIFFGVFALTFNFIFSKKIKQWGFKKQNFVAKIFQNMQQSFGSIKEIILRGNQRYFSSQFMTILFNLNTQAKKLMFISEIPKNALETMAVILVCFVIFFSLQTTINLNELAPIIGLFGAAALRIIPAFNRIIANKQIIDSCYPSVNLVYEEIKDNKDYSHKIENNENENKEYKFENEIELQDIFYKYPEADSYVLQDLNLKIKKNECICIVGDSGSGKTTLVDILSGLLKPMSGKILLDGKQVSFCSQNWRKLIGYVTQSVYLTDDSIKKNILFGLNNGESIDQDRLDLAIKYSQLDTFINQIPEGIEYKVGENGMKLSGGQRQRIGIARTLYFNPKILVLDEITSSLDSDTSASLINCLNNLSGKITMIYISHNNQVINNADIVFKFEKDLNNKLKLIKKFNKNDE